MRGIVLGLGTVVVALSGAVGAGPAPILPPGRAVHIKTKAYEFGYSYPAAAGRIPALKAWLDADLAIARAERVRIGKDHEDHGPYAITEQTDWQVVTNLPGWLSLSADISTFDGFGREGHEARALLWEKAHGHPMKAVDLFASRAALVGAVRLNYCAEMNRRAQNADCRKMTPTDRVVILGSGDHLHFTRIGFLVAASSVVQENQDEAGDITLPVTPAIIAAVKPEYRAAFAVSKSLPTR